MDETQVQNIIFVHDEQFKSEYSEEETSIKGELSSSFDNLKHDSKIGKICCHEPGCNERYNTIKYFRDHLQEIHSFDMSSEMMSFPSMKEFMKWKDSYEEEHCCSFIKKTGSRSTPNIKQSYLYCNRGGFYETKKNSSRKSMKSGAACTASIIYRELSHGEISVTLYPNHYGHEVQSNIMRVLKLTHDLADAYGDPPEEKHQIRTSSGDEITSTPTRSVKTTKKESKNKLQENVSGIPKSCLENDYPSLDAWCVDLMRPPSPAVLYYKPLGYRSNSLSSFDLCLVLMTSHMRHMVASFGDELVYATTLPIPKVNYLATFLFVLDEFQRPFPALIMLSNKINNVYMKVMFEVLFADLKAHKMSIETKVFMTDRNEVLFKQWNEAMHTQSRHMMCPRYIDGEWRRYLATVSNEEMQDEVYDQLCELLEVRDDNGKELLDKVVEKLESNAKCAKFLVYFQKYYTDSFDQWGGHSLKRLLNLHSSPNFEKTVSEIQETLDGKYKKYAKNIVKVLQNLLKHVSAYLYSRAAHVRAALASVDNFHREAMGIDLKQAYRTENENEWQVVDASKENPAARETVRKRVAVPKCSLSEEWECSIACSQCAICLHEYSCTCRVYSVQSTICVHIHLVVRLIRHSLLSPALEKSNAALSSEDPELVPQETEPVALEQDSEQEPEDETSIRKAIIQSLNNTQDKLYLIQDKCKLKALLAIAEELHSLSCEMQRTDQMIQEKEKRTKIVKSPARKQVRKKNPNGGITNGNIVGETKENKEALTKGKQVRLLANQQVLNLQPLGIKVSGKDGVVLPIEVTAINENLKNAVVVPSERQSMNVYGENIAIVHSNPPSINISKENSVSVPTELGTIQVVNKNVFVPTELGTVKVVNKNALAPSELSTMQLARENVVVVPSQNIEIYLKENKNSEEKPRDVAPKLATAHIAPAHIAPAHIASAHIASAHIAPAHIAPAHNVKPKNVVIVDNSRIGVIPEVKPVSKSRIVSVPNSTLESDSNFRIVSVPNSKLRSVSQPCTKSIPNSVDNSETNIGHTKTMEKEQLEARKRSPVVVNVIDKLNRVQINQSDKTNFSQIKPEQIQSSEVTVKPKKPQIKLEQEPSPISTVKTDGLPATPTVTAPCIDKLSASTITSWNIEISWEKKKILIPLFSDPKTEIEKIIQKLNAGHFVYKNEKDKRGDIISSHKSGIIEQLTDIVTSLQNPGRSVLPSKPTGLVTVKLLERQEPLTLKRKIEEFSHQVHTRKHNEVLVVNEANQRKPTSESVPKKVKPNERVANSISQTVPLENNAEKNTCDAKEIMHMPNVKKTLKKEHALVNVDSDVNKMVPTKVSATTRAPIVTVEKKDTPVEACELSDVEAPPAKIPRIETNEATTSADLSQEKEKAPQVSEFSNQHELKAPSKQELHFPSQQESEVSTVRVVETPIMQEVQQLIREDFGQRGVQDPHEPKQAPIQEESGEDPIEQDMEGSIHEEPEAPIYERPIPKRVVRTLRPQMQNKFNSTPKKGVLKVLKPCIRELTKSSEV